MYEGSLSLPRYPELSSRHGGECYLLIIKLDVVLGLLQGMSTALSMETNCRGRQWALLFVLEH